MIDSREETQFGLLARSMCNDSIVSRAAVKTNTIFVMRSWTLLVYVVLAELCIRGNSVIHN
jgi:hypothetical protein